MSYKCEECKIFVKESIPQAKIYIKTRLDKGSRIIKERKVCFGCYDIHNKIREEDEIYLKDGR